LSALKLYFVLINEDLPMEVTVHRDLRVLQAVWEETDKHRCVGLIHISFIRPKISNASSLLKHKGKVLVSVAVKWALPPEYGVSVATVAEMSLPNHTVPLHQLIKGLGFDCEEPSASYQSSAVSTSVGRYTIAEAAHAVVSESERPLNKEEIFARIIQGGLYSFGAKNPLNVLAVELNRYTHDTKYSNPAAEPLFEKFGNDRFISLAATAGELTGWVKQLSLDSPETASAVMAYNIYSEASYLDEVICLPSRLRDQVELYRFKVLLGQIDITDPIAIIRVMPFSIVTSHISSLDISVRTKNVFSQQNISCLGDVRDFSVSDLLKWPNFGRKSVADLCNDLLGRVEKLAEQVEFVAPNPGLDEALLISTDDEPTQEYQVELVAAVPLKEHFEKALLKLTENQRVIIECRTGYRGAVMTLEAVGGLVGVTRERVRQIQKKYVSKIIETEFWDDCIALKIGQLLVDRDRPLYLEMLEVEDPWFGGYMGNYQHLAAVIELFSRNEIQIINLDGATVVTRIKWEDWVDCVSFFRKSLKEKSTEGGWTRKDTVVSFEAALLDKGALELVPLLWDHFSNALQFDGEHDYALLISFGVSAESAVHVVLLQAECPLHYSEVSVRATAVLGRTVDERTAANALINQGAKLYGRGIYGLVKFNPISPRICKMISLVVANLMYAGPLVKQWHSKEILSAIQSKYSALPDELDPYILNIILESSEKLVYLNRMVWARADSNQMVNDRVDMADAFTKILEEHGGPLKGSEIKSRLSAIRGVASNLQLQPTARMVQLGPDFWGLVDRDVGGAFQENAAKLDCLYHLLEKREKGIHVSEVGQYVDVSDDSSDMPSAYALLNLAQRDERFHLARSMFLGLAAWDGDARRLNISQAVRKLLQDMERPMTIGEISACVEDLTEMPVDGTVTGNLISEGAVYDQVLRVWHPGT
jgi:hypothetical protein